MKSYCAKPLETNRQWFVVDAEGKTLGRLATQIATLLKGKHKVTYTPHVDGGDFVIVTNVEKVIVSGNKTDDKMYRHHTGYIGHLKETNFRKLQAEKPEEILMLAVRGMLPKNRQRAQMMKRLRLFVGPEHTHAAQKVQQLEK